MSRGDSPEQVRQELHDADIFVFPSHYESFGIAVLEAQAVGVPVVTSDIPAIREAAGEAARFVPLRDIERWVETIRALIRDRMQREQLSPAGCERAGAFTWQRAAQRLEHYLRLAIARCS